MRENRTCGSEGGEGVSPSRPLSKARLLSPCQAWPHSVGSNSFDLRGLNHGQAGDRESAVE